MYDLLADVKSLIEINPKDYKLPIVDLLLFFWIQNTRFYGANFMRNDHKRAVLCWVNRYPVYTVIVRPIFEQEHFATFGSSAGQTKDRITIITTSQTLPYIFKNLAFHLSQPRPIAESTKFVSSSYYIKMSIHWASFTLFTLSDRCADV